MPLLTLEEALASPLSRFAGCYLCLHCACGSSTNYPLKLLIQQKGDMPLSRALSRMRSKCCGTPPSPAYLQETRHRDYPAGTGPGIFEPPGWWIRLDEAAK